MTKCKLSADVFSDYVINKLFSADCQARALDAKVRMTVSFPRAERVVAGTLLSVIVPEDITLKEGDSLTFEADYVVVEG